MNSKQTLTGGCRHISLTCSVQMGLVGYEDCSDLGAVAIPAGHNVESRQLHLYERKSCVGSVTKVVALSIL